MHAGGKFKATNLNSKLQSAKRTSGKAVWSYPYYSVAVTSHNDVVWIPFLHLKQTNRLQLHSLMIRHTDSECIFLAIYINT